ncbi:unannotated protein [freshwater metagenome]|uniref:Unannotated protein n=1 Tax=freshwater metagenome TaxID=449393 RepID=A0A6J6UFN8_9ZZZZ
MSFGNAATTTLESSDGITSEDVIRSVVPSFFVAVYVQPVIAADTTSTLVFANEMVLPLTAVIAEAALLNTAFEQLVVVILSPTIKPGAELKVSVTTLPVSEPVVIVGVTERTNVKVFVLLVVNFATGSLNLITKFAATAAWVSAVKGVAVVTVGEELSAPIVMSVEKGALKLNTVSAA